MKWPSLTRWFARRTARPYVALDLPAPAPVVQYAMIEGQTICPACLATYPSGTIIAEWPYCPDCSSEAMDIDVQNLEAYLASHTMEDFDRMLATWHGSDKFLPGFKALVIERIERLRVLKRPG